MTAISNLSGLGCGLVLLIVFLISIQTASAQFSDAEREILVALYDATDGDNWINNDKWLTEYGIDAWYGVQVITISRSSRRVFSIDLSGNNLRGKIPSNLGELYDLFLLNVANNPGLSGTLPVELVNLNSLDTFLFDGTNLCESTYSGFQSWIGAVPNVSRTGCLVPTDERLIGTCERSTAEADLDANNVRAQISNVTGLFSTDKYEVPRADSSTVLYGGNLWFAGIVDGTVRASAGRYSASELWPGPLDDQGAPPFDCDLYDHIYKISTSDLSEYETTGFATQDLRYWPSTM